MDLKQTVSVIVGQNVSEEDAMAYARDNFGIIATFLAKNEYEQRQNLRNKNKRLKDLLEMNLEYLPKTEIQRIKLELKEL